VLLNDFGSSGGSTVGSNFQLCGFCEASQLFIVVTNNEIQTTQNASGSGTTRATGVTSSANAMAIRDTIVIIPVSGGVRRSTNGGINWTSISVVVPGVGSDFRGVAWVTGTVWIAVAYTVSTSTNYAYSNDDGATWSTQTTGPNIQWWSCAGSNGTNGVLVNDINGVTYWSGNGINWTTKSTVGVYAGYLTWIDNWAPVATNPMIVVNRNTSTQAGQVIPSGSLSSPDVYGIIKTGSQYMGVYLTFKSAGGTISVAGSQAEVGSGTAYFNFTTTGVTTGSNAWDSAVGNYNDTFFKNITGAFWSGAYAGNGTTGRAISHGLAARPDVILVIPRNQSGIRAWWHRGVCFNNL
jgi:hypothetical protein